MRRVRSTLSDIHPDSSLDIFCRVDFSCSAMLCPCRALSGGAVYVSDYPGKHNFDILRKLVLPDGSILRAQLPGRPTRDALFYDVLRDNTSLLKALSPTPTAAARHVHVL